MKKIITVVLVALSVTSFAQGNLHQKARITDEYRIDTLNPILVPTGTDLLGNVTTKDTAVYIAVSQLRDCMHDDTTAHTSFSYYLLNRKWQPIGKRQGGVIVMRDTDYEDWDGSNSAAMEWIAGKLGVTIK
jgi:hypothetical protein